MARIFISHIAGKDLLQFDAGFCEFIISAEGLIQVFDGIVIHVIDQRLFGLKATVEFLFVQIRSFGDICCSDRFYRLFIDELYDSIYETSCDRVIFDVS